MYNNVGCMSGGGEAGCELPADADLPCDNTYVTDVVLRDTSRNTPCKILSL